VKADQSSLFARRRIRLVRQAESAECGLASLAMIMNYWGRDIDLPELRRRFGISTRGMSLADLVEAADAVGFSGRPIRIDLDNLDAVVLPAIIHWDLNHFVVLERVRGERARIADPAAGVAWHDRSSLSRHFTGVALELKPGMDLEERENPRRLRLGMLLGNLHGTGQVFGQVTILSAILQTQLLASPYFLQIVIDHALPALDLNLLGVLAIGFGLLACAYAIAFLLRSMVLLAAGTALSLGIATNIARHLFRLPIDWFQRRTVGDILSRFQSILPIEKLLTESAAAAIIDGALAALTLAMMLLYSATLTLIPVTAALLYAGFRLLTLSAERNAEGARIIAAGREQTMMIETLEGIVTLRLADREALRHAAWQNRMSEALDARYAHDRVRVWQQAFGALVTSLELVLIVWAGSRIAIGGGFSVGMIFAYLSYQLNFSTAVRRVIDEAIAVKMLGLHLDRLGDIATEPIDQGFHETLRLTAPSPVRLAFDRVSYSYSANEMPVLRDVSLEIEAGEYVALTGPSGGGKSTLVKLLLGLLDPDEGDVLIDGMPMRRFGRRNLRRHVGAVLQDDTLFDGDIAQNVAAFDVVDYVRLAEVLRAADIAKDVERMPMQHHTLVGEMGGGLSGGQRQRLLLARALYRRPAILVIDEGTSNLDHMSEQKINAAVSAMQITRIIVAHRQETIRSADRIVEIRDGKIVRDEHRAQNARPT